MDTSALQRLLAENALIKRFYCYDNLDSTMKHARRLLAGEGDADALHGTLVLAEHQDAGHGRHGRHWQAPPGTSILATVILSRTALPDAAEGRQLSLLAAALPVAVCQGVARSLPAARIKYPNDIVCEGRKLGGVLVEVCGQGVLAGFGVNCSQDLADLPPAAKTPATSLFLETGRHLAREQVLADILTQLQTALEPQMFSQAGEIMSELCETLGHTVIIDTGGAGMVQGIARKINADGNLVLETPGGHRVIGSSTVVRTWQPGVDGSS